VSVCDGGLDVTRRGRSVPARMWRRSLGFGAAVLVLSTCIVSPVIAGASKEGPHVAAPNHHAAVRDALTLMGRLKLPAGARRSGVEPGGDSGLLKAPPSSPIIGDLVDRAQWWTVRKSPKYVMRYLIAHPPTGGNPNESGSEQKCKGLHKDCHPILLFRGFQFPGVSGVLASRSLQVEAARLKNGSTGIRVDAQVVWIRNRAANETVPEGVHIIDVVRANRGQPPSVKRSVVSRARVQRIIGLINRLPITQPGSGFNCNPYGTRPAPPVTFTFRASKHGAPLAQASVPSNVGNSTTACDAMSFSIHGHPEPTLGQPRGFLVTVQRLLGVRLTS
jgi:hypothetical protein